MPSPIGHALAGLTIAWTLRKPRPGGRANRNLAIACAILAALPDTDVLFSRHRGPTHSLGAVLVVTAGAIIVAAAKRMPVSRIGSTCGLAYASHLLLDWLGKDTSAPQGIMVFWPWSSTSYSSGADLFLEISRRYWKPEEFIFRNLRSIAWEVALLLPVAALAWMLKRRNTAHRRQNTE